jgi:hypothetical protein
MYDASTGCASLIDFQFCRFGKPEVDLAVLLGTSASVELRHGENLDVLLQCYNDSYQEHHCGGSGSGGGRGGGDVAVMTAERIHAALPDALHLIVLSYETWTSNFDRDALLDRFASVVEDLAASASVCLP